jgi:hypothetical protein
MRIKFIHHFSESMKQVFFWLPVIWKTRDFDHGYMLEMFHLKMKRLYDFLSSEDAVAMQEEKDLLALKRCVEILDMMYNETYEKIAYEEHYKKYPISPLEEMFVNDPEHPNCRVMKSMKKEESKSFGLAVKYSEKMHKKLLGEFCKLFSTYYRNWWD